jgi:antitoxin HicB
MRSEVTKNLDYYVSLPYGIALRRDDEEDWVAKVEELPGCTAHGGDASEALKNLEEIQRLWLEDAIAAGDQIPEPQASEGLPSGKWLQRVPKSLHRKLTELAKREGVSLNQLATSVLAEAVGRRYEPKQPLVHSEATDLLWLSTLQGSSKWNLYQTKALKINLVDALAATASGLPNQMSDFDVDQPDQFEWKVTRATKKELAYKA